MSDEQNRKRMEDNRRTFEEDSRRRQRASTFPLYTPPSLLQQVSARTSPTTASPTASTSTLSSGLFSTPEQTRFRSPYGSQEPFASPAPRGSDPYRSFTSPYSSREPFGSPAVTSSLRPTNLSDRFSSVETSETSNYASQLERASQQTEPSVRPKVRTQTVTEQSPEEVRVRRRHPAGSPEPQQPSSEEVRVRRRHPAGSPEPQQPSSEEVRVRRRHPAGSSEPQQQSTLFESFPAYRSPPPSPPSFPPPSQPLNIPSAGGRRYSEGDIPAYDLSQQMSELSFDNITPFQQQSEPSVRPKVRTPMQPTGSPPPPIANTIPEPVIVGRYRSPLSGEPYLRSLREPPRMLTRTNNKVINLTNLSRQNINEMLRDASTGPRKRQYLENRGFVPFEYKPPGVKPFTRYETTVKLPKGVFPERSPLVPQRQGDLANQYDPRFNRPVFSMGNKRKPHPLSPLGRQSYGPLPRRAMSMPNLSDPDLDDEVSQPTDFELFQERYSQLKPKHRDYYKNFREQIDWSENPYAQSRMVKAPTLMTIADGNKARLSAIKAQRKDSLRPISSWRTGQQQRINRRTALGQRAVLHPSMEDKRKEWLFSLYSKTIREENEDEEEKGGDDSQEEQ